MAGGGGFTPTLRFKRSAQSGDKVMTTVWSEIYVEESPQAAPRAYIFASGLIDLSTMQAGDTIEIRIRKKLSSTGSWVLHDTMSYTGARPAGHQTAHISGLADTFGVEVSMRQTAGTLRTIPTEFYDAKRLGM